MTQRNLRGYSQALVDLVATADTTTVVGQFSRYCVDCKIPVSQVAQRMGVTRATVYGWFRGCVPRADTEAKMLKVLQKVGIIQS